MPIIGPTEKLEATSWGMPHLEPIASLESTASDEFRIALCMRQPEVVIWIEQHAQGNARTVAIELAARYFETAERWEESMPILKKSRLNIALAEQVPTIAPQDRWMTELPIGIPSADRFAVGRLLRAIVTVCKACL